MVERNLGEVWLAPIDVILDTELELVVRPDLLFISHARSHIVLDRIRGAPDLVVEVVSPNPRLGQLSERIGWFAEYGVAECWIVDPVAGRVDVLTLEDGAVKARHAFDRRTPIDSRILTGFCRSLDGILRY